MFQCCFQPQSQSQITVSFSISVPISVFGVLTSRKTHDPSTFTTCYIFIGAAVDNFPSLFIFSVLSRSLLPPPPPPPPPYLALCYLFSVLRAAKYLFASCLSHHLFVCTVSFGCIGRGGWFAIYQLLYII